MNEHFVSIKVDREERPDVDRVYMTFVQATTGGGGWPHERLADARAEAVFRRHLFSARGSLRPRRASPQCCSRIADAWKNDRRKIVAIRRHRSSTALARSSASGAGAEPRHVDAKLLDAAYRADSPQVRSRARRLRRRAEVSAAGHAQFPVPRLRVADRSDDERSRARHGAAHAAQDGGGRHARSTRRRLPSLLGRCDWHVPHFEKMLYDQAQLAQLPISTRSRSRATALRRRSRATFSITSGAT